MKKSSIGRQKIPIAKIPKKNHLQVTFSKRRAGLFKKASELCTLCGVEIALIVFSPADKAFSFGHPDVDSLVNRYLAQNPIVPTDTGPRGQLMEAHRNPSVRELNVQLTQVLNQLEAEKKRGEALRTARRSRSWWEAPAAELGPDELDQLRAAMEELRSNVAAQAKKLLLVESSVGACFGNYMFDTKPSTVSVRGCYGNYMFETKPGTDNVGGSNGNYVFETKPGSGNVGGSNVGGSNVGGGYGNYVVETKPGTGNVGGFGYGHGLF